MKIKLNDDYVIKSICAILAIILMIYMKNDPEIPNMPINEDYITFRACVGLIGLMLLGLISSKEIRNDVFSVDF